MKEILDHILTKTGQSADQNIRVLLVGTGGGSDIFSTLLVAKILSLHIPKATISVCGVLSPAAEHQYYCEKGSYKVSNPEAIITEILTSKGNPNEDYVTTKIVRTLDSGVEIPFVDNHFWEAVDEMGLKKNIDRAYHLSLRSGLSTLKSYFCNLVIYEKCDFIIGVDVGGDILLPLSSNTVLSPIMDWTVLSLLKNLEVQSFAPPSFILEFGFGLDGESVGPIEDNMDVNSIVLSENMKDSEFWEQAYSSFKKMFFDVMKPVRSGHTIPGFIQYTDGWGDLAVRNERFKHSHAYKILGETVFVDELTTEIFNEPFRAYLISPEKQADKTACYISPLSYAMWLKHQNPFVTTEFDGQIVKTAAWGNMIFAAISRRIPEENRELFIRRAFSSIGKSNNGVIVFPEDMKYAPDNIRKVATQGAGSQFMFVFCDEYVMEVFGLDSGL